MQNSKPRFAYDEESNSIYDYNRACYVPLDGTIEENGGEWDLKALKALIVRNQDITPAFMAGTGTAQLMADKVEQANADFLAYGDDPKPGDPEAAAASDAAVAAALANPEPEPEPVDPEDALAQANAEAAAHAQAQADGQAADVAAAAEAARLKAIEKGELPADPVADPVDVPADPVDAPEASAPQVVTVTGTDLDVQVAPVADAAPVGSGG